MFVVFVLGLCVSSPLLYFFLLFLVKSGWNNGVPSFIGSNSLWNGGGGGGSNGGLGSNGGGSGGDAGPNTGWNGGGGSNGGIGGGGPNTGSNGGLGWNGAEGSFFYLILPLFYLLSFVFAVTHSPLLYYLIICSLIIIQGTAMWLVVMEDGMVVEVVNSLVVEVRMEAVVVLVQILLGMVVEVRMEVAVVGCWFKYWLEWWWRIEWSWRFIFLNVTFLFIIVRNCH